MPDTSHSSDSGSCSSVVPTTLPANGPSRFAVASFSLGARLLLAQVANAPSPVLNSPAGSGTLPSSSRPETGAPSTSPPVSPAALRRPSTRCGDISAFESPGEWSRPSRCPASCSSRVSRSKPPTASGEAGSTASVRASRRRVNSLSSVGVGSMNQPWPAASAST